MLSKRTAGFSASLGDFGYGQSIAVNFALGQAADAC
jgi:hypothetical protein